MKILYLSAHSILEYDEVPMLQELGHEVFSLGYYADPANPVDDKRPAIAGQVRDDELYAAWVRLIQSVDRPADRCLTREFVEPFDVVLNVHDSFRLHDNWDALQGKRVIQRTIGQAMHRTERRLRPLRDQGLEIVRYSPKERGIPGFAGEDAVIRFGKDPAEYGGWTGEKKRVISFSQRMQHRQRKTNFKFFEAVTRPFPRCLFGPGNEAQGDWWGGCIPYEDLKRELRENRVFFFTGTRPASYTLAFMEALMTGIPVVAIGPKKGDPTRLFHHLYEVHELIENGVQGFWSDSRRELQGWIRDLLADDALAQRVSAAGRARAIELFDRAKIQEQWRAYLESGGGAARGAAAEAAVSAVSAPS